MSGNNGYIALDADLFKILDHIPPGDSCPTIIFAIRGHLFKARIGKFSTALYMWTSGGWQLYYKWDITVPLEPDLHDIANKTVVALEATPHL